MGVENVFQSHTQDEVNPIKPQDYKDENGLIRCGVCGKLKQYRVNTKYFKGVVPCICDCVKFQQEQEKAKIKQFENQQVINELKRHSLIEEGSELAGASFTNYKKRQDNREAFNMACNYCRNWKENRRKGTGIIFLGDPGTGKSYTAACIANFLLEKQVPVIMTSFPHILKEIRSMRNEEDYMLMLNSASLLIIDDLGAERDTEYSLENVYYIIDSRINSNKPLILTTNLTMDQMTGSVEMRYKRIYDRIFKKCFPVKVSGKSIREEQAGDLYDEMKSYITGGAK